jgi:hypothetical protein
MSDAFERCDAASGVNEVERVWGRVDAGNLRFSTSVLTMDNDFITSSPDDRFALLVLAIDKSSGLALRVLSRWFSEGVWLGRELDELLRSGGASAFQAARLRPALGRFGCCVPMRVADG